MRFAAMLVSLAMLAGCVPARPPQLTVMAAASLSSAFKELGSVYEQNHPGAQVNLTFAGSQQLAAQINSSAQADLFASASQSAMQTVIQTGHVQQAAAQLFARNKLVIIQPAGAPEPISSWNELDKPGLQLVIAAREVPVGAYSLEFLEKAQAAQTDPDFSSRVLANVNSYEQSVNQVLTRVLLGEADAGIVYTSDTVGKQAELIQVEIPDELNVIAEYPIAILNDSSQVLAAQEFIDLVLSAEGQAVLAKHGFQPAAED